MAGGWKSLLLKLRRGSDGAIVNPATEEKQDAGIEHLLSIKALLQTSKELSESLWTDDSGAYYYRRVTLPEDGSPAVVTYTNPDGTTATPGAGLRPASGSAREIVANNFIATANGTGYTSGDYLSRIVIIDKETSGVAAQFWLNLTSGASIATPTNGTYEEGTEKVNVQGMAAHGGAYSNPVPVAGKGPSGQSVGIAVDVAGGLYVGKAQGSTDGQDPTMVRLGDVGAPNNYYPLGVFTHIYNSVTDRWDRMRKGSQTSANSLAVALSSEQEAILAQRGRIQDARDSQDGILNAILNPSAELTSDFGGVNWAATYTGANTAPTVTRTQVTDALDGGVWVGRLAQGALGVGAMGVIWGHRDTGNYRVVAGRRYVFEVAIRALRSLTNLFQRAHFFPTIGSDTGAVLIQSTPIPMLSGGSWNRLRFEFVAPAGASIVSLSVLVNAPNVVANVMDFDDVRFFEVPSITSWQADEMRDVAKSGGYMLSHEMGGNPNPVFREDALNYLSGSSGSGVDPSAALTRVIDSRTGLPVLRLATAATTTASRLGLIYVKKVRLTPGQRLKIAARVRILTGGLLSTNIFVNGETDAGGYAAADSQGPRVENPASGATYTLQQNTVMPNVGVNHLSIFVAAEIPSGITARDIFQLEELRYWIDGVEQRLDEISAKLPATLGQKSSAASLAVVLASDQPPLKVEGPKTSAFGVRAVPGSMAAADILCGHTAVAGGTIITIPAGRTWHGTVTLSAAVRNVATAAAVDASAQVSTTGIGVTPAAGDYLRLDLSIPASPVGSAGHHDSGAISAPMTIIAPGDNAVALVLNTTGTTIQSASANGQLL